MAESRPEWQRLQNIASLIAEDLMHAPGGVTQQVWDELLWCRYVLLARVEILLTPDYGPHRSPR